MALKKRSVSPNVSGTAIGYCLSGNYLNMSLAKQLMRDEKNKNTYD